MAVLPGEDGRPFALVLNSGDGYDATRLVLPQVRDAFAAELGEEYLVGIPNRDFLIAFSQRDPGMAAGIAMKLCRNRSAVGVEPDGSFTSWRQFETLRAALTTGIVDVGTDLDQMRLRKSEWELSCHRAAARITVSAMDRAVEAVRPGALDSEVAAEAERGQRFEPPLSGDELAFYDAVSTNESAVELQGEDVLVHQAPARQVQVPAGQAARGDQAGDRPDGVDGSALRRVGITPPRSRATPRAPSRSCPGPWVGRR